MPGDPGTEDAPVNTDRDPAAAPRVVLGVCGGIAAYKAIEVCRQLVDAGFEPVPVDLSELLKGGGSVKCCTLEVYP